MRNKLRQNSNSTELKLKDNIISHFLLIVFAFLIMFVSVILNSKYWTELNEINTENLRSVSAIGHFDETQKGKVKNIFSN